MEGRKLSDIQRELSENGLQIPFSSMHDLKYKFLFYFGHLHRLTAPRLKAHLEACGKPLWLIDGTLEPNTPVFFGVQEARSGIFLNCVKMPAEQADDIAACLKETGRLYGDPESIMRDLSTTVEQGINAAFPDAIQFVCQYHFVSALGEALCMASQNALLKRLRAMKLQVRLKYQRTDQASELRRELAHGQAQAVLSDLLNGHAPVRPLNSQMGREVLLALHYWILDYVSDGQRQGFPFDPYTLYLHRRLVKAQQALQNFLESTAEPQSAPIVLRNLAKKLTEYTNDPIIRKAAEQFEKAYRIFNDVREVLRLKPKGSTPMRDSYDLKPDEQMKMGHDLQALRAQLEGQGANALNSDHQKLYGIAVKYLDKYSPFLPGMENGPDINLLISRTNNRLESHWGSEKKNARVIHGRKKITKDFQALPPEVMLVPNLKNLEYVKITIGSLEALPNKLAEAAQGAGSFSAWRKGNRTLKLGKLPTPVMRKNNFLDDLLRIFERSIQLARETA